MNQHQWQGERQLLPVVRHRKGMRLLVQVISHQQLGLEYQRHQQLLLIDQVDLVQLCHLLLCRAFRHNQYGE